MGAGAAVARPSASAQPARVRDIPHRRRDARGAPQHRDPGLRADRAIIAWRQASAARQSRGVAGIRVALRATQEANGHGAIAIMRTLAKTRAEPGIWMAEAPKPTVGPNDVLIRIRKTAICGTDMHIYNWDDWAQKTIPVPMHVGHEYVGEIVEMGQEVRGFALGDRVSGEGHITCGHCRNCRAGRRHLCRNTVGVGVNREGAFAEYLVIPAMNAFRVPDDISDDL